MSKIIKAVKNVNDLVFHEKDANTILYTHSVFCQCVLPVRSLPREQDLYETSHGNTSLSIHSGYIRNHETKRSVKQEIPSGAKARLLFSYINDQAIRKKKPDIDMGSNLYRFMQDNNIPVGGKNAKELQRQAMNIAAASIHLGVFGETESQHFSTQRNMQIAKDISFWLEKDPTQGTLWQPTMTLSDDYMAALEHHRVPINFHALVSLQANPRAMDMYVWLKYRVHSVRSPVKIKYEALHSVFGQTIGTIKEFKVHIKKAIGLAKMYCPEAEVEFDKDHITLINVTKSFISYSTTPPPIIESGGKVSNKLSEFGIAEKDIRSIMKQYDDVRIEDALLAVQEHKKIADIKNPIAILKGALKEEWSPGNEVKKQEKVQEFDSDYEDKIVNGEWKEVRQELRKKYGDSVFNNWIKHLEFIEKGRGEVLLSAPTGFIKKWCEKNYLETLQKFWKESDNKIKSVKITIVKKK